MGDQQEEEEEATKQWGKKPDTTIAEILAKENMIINQNPHRNRN